MTQHDTDQTAQKLDQSGRALVRVGALVMEAFTILGALAAAWFISYFSDGSSERGLAAMLDVWPVWVVAVVLIVLVSVGLARVMRGGRVALVIGGLAGLIIALACLWMLLTGSHETIRTLLLGVGLVGGLALAAGAIARLRARAK